MTILASVNNKTVMPGITPIADVPDAPTIGTATAGGASGSVTFTAAATGGVPTSYTATSNPGSFTGTASSSPVTVTGLTPGTSYTFTVTATNSTGTSPASSASNSITALTPVDSSYDALATVIVPSGGLSLINFAGIPAGYKHLQIRYISRITSTGYVTGGSVYMRFNNDTSNNYSFHSLRGNGSSATSVGQTSTGNNVMYVHGNTGSGSSNTLIYGTAIIDILDYASNTKNKVISVIGAEEANGSGIIDLDSGAWYSTSPITSIQLTNGTFTPNSHFALYGVK
jgi:hypothetical protein